MTEYLKFSILIFNFHFPGFQPEKSNCSEFALKTDAYPAGFNDYRDFPETFGELQHAGKTGTVFYDVIVVECPSLPGKSCTSRPGVGSGIFSINHDLISHLVTACVAESDPIFSI